MGESLKDVLRAWIGGKMSPKDRNSLAIVPTSAGVPEIGRYLWMLEDIRGKTKRSLAGIAPAALDWAPLPAANTIGTLLYHIALVEADWFYVDVLEGAIPEDLAAHLPYDGRDERGHLTVVVGRSVADHFALLDEVRTRVLTGFGAMSLDEFYRSRPSGNIAVTPEWCVYHLIEHEATHRGEIEMAKLLAEAALAVGTG